MHLLTYLLTYLSITILLQQALSVYFDYFFNKNKQSRYSDNTHHFSLTVNKITQTFPDFPGQWEQYRRNVMAADNFKSWNITIIR